MVSNRITIRPIILTALELFLMFYLILLNARSSYFIDLWVLENILVETIIVITATIVTAWFIFRKTMSTSLFVSIILLSLLIAIPVIKYPNNLLLYGPYDSTAFYSFTKWIVDTGHVAANDELYYSDQYGNHPGIAVIPAVLQIITGLDAPLTVAMNIVLAVGYSTYTLVLLCALKRLGTRQYNEFLSYLFMLSFVTFFMFFNPYYRGVEIGYSFVSISLYLVISMMFRPREGSMVRSIILGALIYTGLLLTHYSTAVIMALYFLMLVIGALIFRERHDMKPLAQLFLSITVIFLSYEFYVDTYLSSSTTRTAFKVLHRLYVQELEIAAKALEIHTSLTFLNLFKYLVNQYAKIIIILVSMLIYTLTIIFKWKGLTEKHRLLIKLFTISLPTWIAGWAGIGDFMSGRRAISLIQFLFVLNIIYYYFSGNSKSLSFPIRKRRFLLSFTAFLLIVTGFSLNYNIPVAPLIQTDEGDTYTYPSGGQVAITPWSLHPIEFANSFLNQHGPSFLCIQPYTGFGLCDLLWGKPKIPTHGFVSPQFTTVGEVLKLISSYANVVIPIPSSDKVFPGPIGYKSYYLTPYSYCANQCDGKIYTNGLYNLFVKR